MRILIIIIALFTLASCGNVSEEQNSVTVISDHSELTCPECGHKQTEVLPTEYCLLSYTCEKCNRSFHPKDGDCCVFCSFGDHKCPSMQE